MAVFEYLPAGESPELARLQPGYGLFIDGQFTDSASGSASICLSPATEEALTEVALAGADDLDRAVLAARTAYQTVWRPMPGSERAKYLYRLARLLQERAPELALLESLNTGRPIRETRGVDVPLAAAHFFYHAGWADKLRYAGLGTPAGGPAGVPDPLGVAGLIVGWASPLLTLARTVAPALACGNTVVLCLARQTPLSALRFAELCQQADLPPGVLNIVTGPAEIGTQLAAHRDVDVVTFTGQTPAGRTVARAVAGTAKRLNLELGGKSANIVFDDAPIDEAIDGIVGGVFFNQAQLGSAGSRLLVQESAYDEVLDALKRRMSRLRLGDPLDRNTDVGPVISAEQLARLQAMVTVTERAGGQPWSPPTRLPERGYWFPPTVVAPVAPADRIARDEFFGPVLSVLTFRTPAEAVEKANNTPYGMAAGVWSEKGSRALSVANRLRAGVVWANTFNTFDPASPFGGYKESGYGRHGGRHGLEAYLA